MKSTNNFQTSNPEMVTISRAEYEAQQERIAELEQQVSVLMEALRLDLCTLPVEKQPREGVKPPPVIDFYQS